MTQPNRQNRLSREKSAYLKQHATNPVDWYPWGDEAFIKAKSENKPIFLSIGYSSCHWCHVMEHESFSNDAIAELLNKYFVSIKVDREERPDIDHIYMSYVQLITGRGGWPLSVFISPEKTPFYGGTYFPPQDKYGIPSFTKVLRGVASNWKEKKSELLQSGLEVSNVLKNWGIPEESGDTNTHWITDSFSKVSEKIESHMDKEWGGMGNAPKFFHTAELTFLIWSSYQNRQPVTTAVSPVDLTFSKILLGGTYDLIGGGFHRYSTDTRWLIPHFEKMLYDNGLLISTLTRFFQTSPKNDIAKSIHETIEYLNRDLKHAEGAFFSAEDADSEGHEGTFYIWSLSEFTSAIPSEFLPTMQSVLSVTEKGNWEGKNILRLPKPISEFSEEEKTTLDKCKRLLLEKRSSRIRPFRDTKIIFSWNAFTIIGLSEASRVFHNNSYLQLAIQAVNHLMRFKDANSDSIPHVLFDNEASGNGYLDDYASLILAHLELYASTQDIAYLKTARSLGYTLLKKFWDEDKRLFWYSELAHGEQLSRVIEWQDGAVPSSLGLATLACASLGRVFQDSLWESTAMKCVSKYKKPMLDHMASTATLWKAALLMQPQNRDWIIIPGANETENEETISFIKEKLSPLDTLHVKNSTNESMEFFANRSAVQNEITAYICKQGACEAPAVGKTQIMDRMTAT